MKSLDELRSSNYHQELGQKMWAAFLAQQQGISLSSAVKKVGGPVGDLWLMVADFALQDIQRRRGTAAFTANRQAIQILGNCDRHVGVRRDGFKGP